VTTIKILGITVTNHLSMGEHVRDVIGKCAVPVRLKVAAQSRYEWWLFDGYDTIPYDRRD